MKRSGFQTAAWSGRSHQRSECPYLVGEGVQAGWAGVGQARVGPPLLQQELNLVVLHKTVECAVRNGCVLAYYSFHSANTADTPDIIALQRKYNQTNIKNGLVAVDPFSLNVLSHK